MEMDSFCSSVLQALNRKATKYPQVSLAESVFSEKPLRVNGLIYVPDYDPLRLGILRSRNDCTSAGHPGHSNTYELVFRNFWWPGLRKYLARYVDNYLICSRSKATKHAPFGKLKPLEISERPWNSISMDFITSLPESECINTILVVFDRLSKM